MDEKLEEADPIIESCHAFAVEFIQEQDFDEAIETLLQITDKSEPPDWRTQYSTSFDEVSDINITWQNWKEWTPNQDSPFEFLSLNLTQVLGIPNVTFLILSGGIQFPDNPADSNSKPWISSKEYHNELTEKWNSIFEEAPFGFLSSISSKDDSIMATPPPLTFSATRLSISDISEVFNLTDDSEPGLIRDIDQFSQEIRTGSFCNKFQFQPHGLISIWPGADSVLFGGQIQSTVTGWSQLMHDSYSFVEFSESNGDSMFMDSPIGQTEYRAFPTNTAVARFLNALPMLFYFYWFWAKSQDPRELDQTLREIPVGISDYDIDELADQLRPRRAEFYGNYVRLLQNEIGAEKLIRQNKFSLFDGIQEQGLPLLPEQDPTTSIGGEDKLGIYDYEAGLLGTLSRDIAQSMRLAKDEYDAIREPFEIAVDELDKRLRLSISQENRRINRGITILTGLLVIFGLIGIFGVPKLAYPLLTASLLGFILIYLIYLDHVGRPSQ